MTDCIVPCNGCTLCCQGDAVRLLPGDDIRKYKTEFHPLWPGALMLAHKENGDCWYLDREKGCTIHEDRPQQCREMDCRRLARMFNFKRMQGTPGLKYDVWKRGKDLIKEGKKRCRR